MKTGRNDPCPCGSGKKYKKCCEAADEARQRIEQAERQAEVDQEPAQIAADKPAPPPRLKTIPTANQSNPHLRRGMLPRRG